MERQLSYHSLSLPGEVWVPYTFLLAAEPDSLFCLKLLVFALSNSLVDGALVEAVEYPNSVLSSPLGGA